MLSLPNELLLHISGFCSPADRRSLALTCWDLHNVVSDLDRIARENLAILGDHLADLETSSPCEVTWKVWADDEGRWIALQSPLQTEQKWVGKGPCPWSLYFKRPRRDRPWKHIPVPPASYEMEISYDQVGTKFCNCKALNPALSKKSREIQKITMELLESDIASLQAKLPKPNDGWSSGWYQHIRKRSLGKMSDF